jgi:hypothetical protein
MARAAARVRRPDRDPGPDGAKPRARAARRDDESEPRRWPRYLRVTGAPEGASSGDLTADLAGTKLPQARREAAANAPIPALPPSPAVAGARAGAPGADAGKPAPAAPAPAAAKPAAADAAGKGKDAGQGDKKDKKDDKDKKDKKAKDDKAGGKDGEAGAGGKDAKGRGKGGGDGGAPAAGGDGAAVTFGSAAAVEDDGAMPEQVAGAAEAAPTVPLLNRVSVSTDWPLASRLGADALPKPGAAANPRKAAPGAPGGAAHRSAHDAGPSASDPEAVQRKDREAADLAQRAYEEVTTTARREQETFVGHANEITNYMANAYGFTANAIVHGLDRDGAAIDAAAERAAARVESAATFATMQLDASSNQTAVAIEAAGGSAYGLIGAGESSATAQIGGVVSGLMAGHMSAYAGIISATTAAADAAVLALKTFRDDRATLYPTGASAPMEGAKNESIQSRIPRWVEPETKRIEERVKQKTTGWGTARDSAVCGLSCSFSAALNAENTKSAKQARQSVSSALTHARETLAQQTRDARRTLRDLRRSALRQIQVQRRTTRSRLTSQARSSLTAVRSEAGGAVNGIQGAARSAMPSYWRGAQGLEQSLRRAAPGGAQAVEQIARRAPASILEGVHRSSAALDERLEGNRLRLQRGLADRGRTQRQASEAIRTQFEASLEEQNTQTVTRFDESVASFVTAFSGLADTVAQSAASWAQPVTTRMSGLIAAKRTEAQNALTQSLTGAEPAKKGDAGAAKPAAAGKDGAGEAPAPSCACPSTAGGDSSGGGGGGAQGPKGLTADSEAEIAFYTERHNPAGVFKKQIGDTRAQVETQLEARAVTLTGKFSGGFLGSVDEAGVLAALHGLTQPKGSAFEAVSYPYKAGTALDADLRKYLGATSRDYGTARLYIAGNAVAAAKRELQDSLGFFNDDEARIEATMRALSPDQLKALGGDKALVKEIGDALDGTDKKVFDALAAGDHALADAHRMRDKVDSARLDNDADAVHRAIEEYTGAPAEDDWRASEEMSAEERRAKVVEALGGILAKEARAAGKDVKPMSAEDRVVAYVTRDIEVYVGHTEQGEPVTVTRKITGANRDLADALLRHGSDSVQARVARLGVELQRPGDPPDPIKLDKAVFDQRFAKDKPNASPEERAANERGRQAARADRERVLLLAAQNYAREPGAAGEPVDPTAVLKEGYKPKAADVTDARAALVGKLGGKFGSDKVGAELAKGLLTDERPSAKTASLAMQHAMYAHWGTNEELLFRFTERMDRDEIAEMRTQFAADTGKSLDAELGVYGEGGTFTELSGDDRLRMERAMRGVARTDREKLENAAFAIDQQRRETGSFGKWLAKDTVAARVMNNTSAQLETLAGGPIAISRRGDIEGKLGNFNPATGEYTGKDRDTFAATTGTAQAVAENYAKRIDAFADLATTGIAILGAIAAAVIGVVTLGAAVPLMAAALVTGLASMAANYTMKGGRYGWEQAGIDLAMTVVQVVTAGVGAQLGAAAQVASKGATAASMASRTLTQLAKIFTGHPIIDQIIIGAITGSIGGLAGAAINEQTWDGKDPALALLGGLLRGALAGAATSAVTSGIDNIGQKGSEISARMQGLVAQGGLLKGAGSMVARGVGRGLIAGAGGVAGRGAEILFDVATGKYKGDAGDALVEMGHAGLHSAVQGFGEGAAEAVGQRTHNKHMEAAQGRIKDERSARGLRALDDHALGEAAGDLVFLQMHGRDRGPGADARHFDHIVTHGGMKPTVATIRPVPVVVDQMRAELMRHVPPEQHAAFDKVPIRVLSERDYHVLTRSKSGPVVTLIENGRPVVVVREGTILTHLSDEGPHLMQAREARTRERVARLDEATLARWDHLDLDTQLGLYQNKIELEIDAHQRVGRSLEESAARGTGKPHEIAAEIERNEGTLRNLRERLNEVNAIGPERRAAMSAGDEPRPQYLEQPARLFTKEAPPKPRPAAGEPALARGAAAPEAEAGAARPHDEATPEALRLKHEAWVENMRTGLLHPGSMPPMAEGLGATRFMSIHEDIDSAYAVYNATVKEHNGKREVGIYRDDHTGRFMVVLGDPTHIRLPSEFKLPETVLHFHPDFGPSLYRGPSGTDLNNTLAKAFQSKRPATEFIEFDVPGQGRARTAFTVTPVHDVNAPDGVRLRIELEFVNVATGKREHQTFASRAEWSEYYSSRKTALDPDGPAYKALMKAHGMSDAQIARSAEGHRPEGTPAPAAAPDPRSPGGRTRNAAIEMPERAAGEIGIRASVHEAEQHAGAMHEELMRHVPPEHRDALAGSRILVLPDAEYRALTRSDSGPVVTVIHEGKPTVLIREGTDISRLADEGPHLVQAREAGTRARVARLDEAELAHWDHLDIDRQIDLYRNKIELEIDAHQRIGRSLEDATARGHGDPRRNAADRERNEGTLRNLRARLEEVGAIDPVRRAAIDAGREERPQYLEQPPRLFSKDEPPAGVPKPPRVAGESEAERARTTASPATEAAAAPVRTREQAKTEFGVLTNEIREVGTQFKSMQGELERFSERVTANQATQKQINAELAELKARGITGSDRETDLRRRLASARAIESSYGASELAAAQGLRAALDTLLPTLARQIAPELEDLIAAMQRFRDARGGRRLDALHVIDSLRNRAKENPAYGNLEGLISLDVLQQNVLAVAMMREHIGRVQPDVVLAVQRGGAFLAEVLARGAPGFPPSVVVEKHVEVRANQPDDVKRTPNLDKEIRARIQAEPGQTKFAIVDFYMGGIFAGELKAMINAIHNDFPDKKLQFDIMWMREAHGFERTATWTKKTRRAELAEGISFVGGVRTIKVPDSETGGTRSLVRLKVESEMVMLPVAHGNEENLPYIRVTSFPVALVLGDDMQTVFDPNSKLPIRLFDRNGIIVRTIPVGTIDPQTGEPLRNTRDIVVRLMQGMKLPPERVTRAQLEEGVTLQGRLVEKTVTDPRTGERRTILQIERALDIVTLPGIAGTPQNVDHARAAQGPTAVVFGDGTRTVFDPDSPHPLRIVDSDGRLLQTIPVGAIDPETGERLRSTREIVIRLMQGAKFPTETE